MKTSRSRGFTLIEILLGLALIGMLAGGIFSVQRGALSVSAEVVARETQTLKVHSFCELLRRNFEQMPGNARVNLQLWGGAGSDLTEVAFTDYPLAFTWAGVEAGSKTVIFRTERSVETLGLQAAILYLNEEQSDAWSKGKFADEDVERLKIIDGIDKLDWHFFNETTQKWDTEWPLTNTRRPTFVHMTLQFLDGDDPVALVFWIPTMANPQQFTTFGAPGQGNPQPPGAGGPGGQPGGGQPASGMSDGRPPGGGRGEGGRGGGGRGGGGGRPQGGGRGR